MEIDHLHLLIQLFYSEKSGLQSSDRGSGPFDKLLVSLGIPSYGELDSVVELT